ncbi:MAG TPA: HEAT repeat domain-containing protein, partial [Candidatus Krumholzibacteria bacterium]|nr:HEAT repeat domain-containing protein [Candidatus Krumholzibacteria bacterium]
MKQHRRIIIAGIALALCVASFAQAGTEKTPKPAPAPKAAKPGTTPIPATPATPAAPAVPAPLPPNTERGAYEQIKNMIYDAQYQQAHEASLRFLKKYVKSVNAEEVSFWKCYALQRATRDVSKSFDCYQTFLTQYPSGSWSDDARSEYVKLAKKLAKAGDPRGKAALDRMADSGDDGDADIKMSVIYALLQSNNEGDTKLAMDSIHQVLKTSKDPDLRRKVIYVLTESDDPQVLDTLIDVAKTDPDADVRRHAIYAISDQNDEPRVIDTLVGLMKTEKDPDIRRHVLYAIAEVDRPDVIKVLSDAAVNDADPDIRTAATYAIAEVDDPAAVTALKTLLKSSTTSFEIKKAALYAL